MLLLVLYGSAFIIAATARILLTSIPRTSKLYNGPGVGQAVRLES